jgi:hypothetical protein
VKFRRDAGERQAQIIKDQPSDQQASDGGYDPPSFRCACRFMRIAGKGGYASYADHAAGVLGYTFTAEEQFARGTLRHRLAQIVIKTALIEKSHRFFRRS